MTINILVILGIVGVGICLFLYYRFVARPYFVEIGEASMSKRDRRRIRYGASGDTGIDNDDIFILSDMERHNERFAVNVLTNHYPTRDHQYRGKFVRDLSDGMREFCEDVSVLTVDKYFKQGLKDASIWEMLRFIFYQEANMFRYYGQRRKRWMINHAHWWFPSGLSACLFHFMTGTAYFITCHGADIYILDKKKWLKPLAKFVLRRASGVNAVSKDVARRVLPLLKDDQKVFVQAMPYDDDVFHAGSDDERIGVLAGGRLIKRKGFDVLLEAVKTIDGHKLQIFGSGPEKDSLTRLQGQHRNTWIPPIHQLPAEGVADCMQMSTVFVMPSIVDEDGITESVGMVAIEAMACGCPVIASLVGGVHEYLHHGHNGLLVEPGNVVALTKAINRILTMPEVQYKTLQLNGLETAKKYTKKYVGEKFAAWYEQSLNTNT